MGSKVGNGTRPEVANKGGRKMSSNIKTYVNDKMSFAINLDEYGGDVQKAKDKITEIFDSRDVKNKVRKMSITPIEGSELYKVDLVYKVWI